MLIILAVLAGAAAGWFTPDTVICTVGGLGALCAVPLPVRSAARPRAAASAASEQLG